MTESYPGPLPKPQSAEELNAHYKDATTSFTQAIIDALSVSQATRGLPSSTGDSRYWATVLFSRMCAFATSMHKLMPGSAANTQGTVFDFSSVAALLRSLHEAYLCFLYLCDPSLSQDDYRLRLRLVQLHDCMRRPAILTKMGIQVNQQWFDGQRDELKADIQANPVFLAMDAKRQAELLKGKTSFYLSQDELVAQVEGNVEQIRGLYEFLSSHTHSYAFSFLHTPFHGDRGTGRENDAEKSYLIIAAEFGRSILDVAVEDMKRIFHDVQAFPRFRIEWETLTSHPISQASNSGFIMGMKAPGGPSSSGH